MHQKILEQHPKTKSTIDQSSIIGQIMETKYKYRQHAWRVFVDFNNAYGSIHKESFYDIMYTFEYPKKTY